MEVYIEYVILDNLIINALILLLTRSTLKLKMSKVNIFLSSLIGTIFAVVMPFISLTSYIMLAIKITVGLIMVLILKKYKNLKEFIITFLLFITYTFCLGGVCFGIMYLFNSNLTIQNLVILGFDLPMGVFVLLLAIYVYLLFKTVKVVQSKKKKLEFLTELTLINDDVSYTLTGFMDTGNQITHEGQPVIVLSLKPFLKIFKNISYEKVFFNNLNNNDLKNLSYITVNSVNSQKNMPLFTVDELIISDKRLKEPRIALTKTNFSNDFDCILPPELF